jgi:hypothetical protein
MSVNMTNAAEGLLKELQETESARMKLSLAYEQADMEVRVFQKKEKETQDLISMIRNKLRSSGGHQIIGNTVKEVMVHLMDKTISQTGKLCERWNLMNEKDNQLTAAQSEVERLKEDQFNSHEKIMIFFEGIDRGNDVKGVSLIDKVSALIDLAKYTHSTIKALTTEANSYRDLYDELKALVLIDSYKGRHNDITHGETLNYVKEERQMYAELDKEYTKADSFERKYRRLVALLDKAHKKGMPARGLLTIHRENEKAYKARVGK